MASYWRSVAAIVWKDLRSEYRSKEMMSSMLIFAFLVILIFAFAFDPSRRTLAEIFPGILWTGFFFAGMLGLGRSISGEKINDSLQGLMLCPVDWSAIYFAKVISNLILMTIMELVSLPIFFGLFDYSSEGPIWWLLLVVFLGTFGFVAVGTFLAALATNTRSSEILLPVILFPVTVPIVLGSVEMTASVLAGAPFAEIMPWLKVVLVYDAVFVVVPFLLFDYLLEV